jgi:type VI secretion system protein ImpK
LVVSAIYWASAEVLVAAVQLAADGELSAPATLRDKFVSALQQMVTKSRAAGVPDEAIAEAHYALVAFIDERILKSNWPGRAEWMNNPLQLQLYREFRAGENFFARMGAILQRTPAPPSLEIYYLCLALGFTGAHGAQNARSFLEAAAARIPRSKAALSPHAVPTDHYTVIQPRRPLALLLALGCVLAVALGLTLLWWSLGSAVDGTASELASSSANAATDGRG